jgi:hypothetical protein
MRFSKTLSVLLVVAALSIPLLTAHAAGASIAGKITNPKGAAIGNAVVTVFNTATKQEFPATTDPHGRYKVEGLPAGTYTVRVIAKGFSEGRRDDVKVEDNSALTIDMRLEASD